MGSCPLCGRSYGRRKRCYSCHGKPKTAQTVACKTCGQTIHVQPNQKKRGEGIYCSIACKAEWKRRSVRPLDQRRPYVNRQGYVMVAVASGRGIANYRGEHRVVMETFLGRSITPYEHIHHINGNKQDNRLENLELLSNQEHYRAHHPVS